MFEMHNAAYYQIGSAHLLCIHASADMLLAVGFLDKGYSDSPAAGAQHRCFGSAVDDNRCLTAADSAAAAFRSRCTHSGAIGSLCRTRTCSPDSCSQWGEMDNRNCPFDMQIEDCSPPKNTGEIVSDDHMSFGFGKNSLADARIEELDFHSGME